MPYKYAKNAIEEQILPNIPYLLVMLSILISHFVFKGEDLKTFLSFVVLIPIFTYFKWDGRIPVGYALVMLIAAAIVLAFMKNESLANQLAIYAYWLLVTGVLCLTIEYMRESKNSEIKSFF
ncbi:MAG: hypothetical protein KQA41_03425 [Candidatus Aenigmarchaeota archaeon]|nr:hypothetical protein [Candidatus Aenigmarchaeota archaeon]